MQTINIFMVLIQLAALSSADNFTSITETTETHTKSTTPMTLATPTLQDAQQKLKESETDRPAILRIKPEQQETAKIFDILEKQLIEKDKLNTTDGQERLGAVTEMIKMENSTIPTIDLGDLNIQQNTERGQTDMIADLAKPTQKVPEEQVDLPSDFPPFPTPLPRNYKVQETTNETSTVSDIIVGQTESSQHQQTDVTTPGSLVQPYLDNGIRDQPEERTEDANFKQRPPVETTTSLSELVQPIPVVLSRGSEVQLEEKKDIADTRSETRSKIEKRDEKMETIDQQQLTEASNSQIIDERTTEVPSQKDYVEAKDVEETTQIDSEITEKPSLLERMKHNRHRKFKSEEEMDKSEGPVPCTCGVFLSGQFKKGSKQQPKGLPVLTQEMDTPFMNNAVGNRQCTNKCLELIIKHLPKSSEIICATVDRENVFKERAYLFVKNHSDKWHGTNLSAGREFCCRDNTPYKCPVS